MSSFVASLRDIDKTDLTVFGGKGANLGELTNIEGIRVPDGFCVSTVAFEKIIEDSPFIKDLLDHVSLLKVEDRNEIKELSAKIRRLIEETAIPQDISEEIIRHLDEMTAYAVRSSATAEDLPTASFAGQQDSYLNITGKDAILKHISKCWASLFTDRAVIYRMQTGFDQRKVKLAVVVQQMVFPQAAGILFTADPVTSDRKVLSIDAGFGLGEALVSGLVNADVYKVRQEKIIDKKISTKKLGIYAREDGGTKQQEIGSDQQNRQVLTDPQIVELGLLGRKIEEHFGSPQDIEWCLADDTFYIVQSRPITTLYPIPPATDGENHVYISVGHQQMMTDAIKPLGLSFFMLTTARPMYHAGGRLFVDVAPDLASRARRDILVNVLGKSDPLIKGALTSIMERGDFIRASPDEAGEQDASKKDKGKTPPDFQTLMDYDPAIVPELIRRSETSIDELEQAIRMKSGSDLIDFIWEDTRKLRKSLSDPQGFGVIMSTMNASSWINEKMEEWLGEKAAADTIAQSVRDNVTSQMGLELLDVADVIRPCGEVINYLQRAGDTGFLEELAMLDGGQEANDAIDSFLKKYGMRCSGEIDITRTRWSEKPATLIPIILSNIKNFAPGAGKRKFEQGQQDSFKKEQELLGRLKRLPEGEQKAEETKRMIDLVRNYSGYREYPKYGIVSRYLIYKQALLNEAAGLVQSNVLLEKEDIYYLTFEELREVVRTKRLDYQIIHDRKEEFKLYEKLRPPRVFTSDGEVITAAYQRENIPAGALVGLAVSSGVVEGRARVILSIDNADLEDGDILITPFTDPSWTPLFLSIKGLVTEVGGLMTHGAVIAREYGLPAVVGVENATSLIKDGQRIRVNGTDGYVEIL